MRYQITYGHTLPSRNFEYFPALEGYRPGAEQELIGFQLEFPVDDITPEEIAEAVFAATNAPLEVVADSAITTAVVEALHRLHAEGFAVWVMNVGDTVLVKPRGCHAQAVFLSCESFSWKRRDLSEMVAAA